MAAERSPARMGIDESLLNRFAAIGWIDPEGLVAEQAVPVLQRVRSGPEPEATLERLVGVLETSRALASRALDDRQLGAALAAVAGGSRALTATLRRHPEWLTSGDEEPIPAEEALTGENLPERYRAVRRFVRRRLLRVAVRDLLGMASMPEVGRELADTADAAAAAALVIADQEARRSGELSGLSPIPLTVIAMGKWGGRELNYSSDIDVLFVYDLPEGTDPERARRYAIRTATEFMAALGKVTAEGAAFRVDADLRPEGKNGPLARSLDSYSAYYEKWAQTWEFQALIKARPAAGDPQLGEKFLTLIAPHIYPDTLDPNAIRAIRTMKARIEAERLPPGEDPDFHLKLGPGGMSDVEFLAQLHQMRQGGRHPRLRVQGTIPALEGLGIVESLGTAESLALIDAYSFCGAVRNRLYLQVGRPVDSLPGDPEELTRLALSLGYEEAPRSALREDYRRHTRRARRIVERRFYHDL